MRGMRRRSVDCAATGRRPRSGFLFDGRPAEDGERGDHGKVFGVAWLSKKLFQTSSRASQFSFQVRWDWTFLFPLFAQLRYEKHMRVGGSQGPISLFDPCRLGLFLAYCAKGSNRSNFPWIQMPRWLRWGTLLRVCVGRVNRFLKLPSKQCSASQVLECLLRFHSIPQKSSVFQVPPVVQNIGHVKRKFHEVVGGMRCGPAH